MNQPDLIRTVKRLSWIVLGFGALIVILSAIETKQGKTINGMPRIKITPLPDGNSLLNDGDILTILDKSFGIDFEDTPISSIDITRVERVLEEDPFILNADAYINALNELHIEVWQREPVLRIMDNNGLNYYLDIEGNQMPLSPHFAARVPVATGSLPPHVPKFYEREKYLLRDVFELTKLLRNDPFYAALVEQIHVNQRGELTLVPKVGRQKILFGTFDKAEDKLRRLKIFYQEGMPYEGWRKYKTINVKFDGQVVCEK